MPVFTFQSQHLTVYSLWIYSFCLLKQTKQTTKMVLITNTTNLQAVITSMYIHRQTAYKYAYACNYCYNIKNKSYLILFQIYYFQVLVPLQTTHAMNFVLGQFQLLNSPQTEVKIQIFRFSHFHRNSQNFHMSSI